MGSVVCTLVSEDRNKHEQQQDANSQNTSQLLREVISKPGRLELPRKFGLLQVIRHLLLLSQLGFLGFGAGLHSVVVQFNYTNQTDQTE